MEDQYTIAEAKNRLPSIIHSVEKGPSVKLTRRGRHVATQVTVAIMRAFVAMRHFSLTYGYKGGGEVESLP